MCTVTAERDVWDAYIKVSNIYFIKDSCFVTNCDAWTIFSFPYLYLSCVLLQSVM
jgi:hypothetical protein